MAAGKKGLVGAILLALCLLGISSSSASQQSSPGDTLVVKIGPLPQNYMYFDPVQATSLINAVLAGTARYDSANPLCTGELDDGPVHVCRNRLRCSGHQSGLRNQGLALLSVDIDRKPDVVSPR